MNLAIVILGLFFLILIHEAGHFFVALAVGMRPRRFYVGFPPALVKTTHKGIEYGIGAIPLGGYVKIPGMHRPAPGDLDMYFGSALREAPQLLGPVERVKRELEAGDFQAARVELPALETAVADAGLGPAAARAAARGLRELADALGEDAYWRQRTWKRVGVIFAGPGTNIVFAVALLAVVYMIGVPVGARSVESVDAKMPAASAGLRPGDVIVAVNGHATRTFAQVSERIRASKGAPIRVTVERKGRLVRLPPRRTKKVDGTWIFGFHPDVQFKSYGPAGAIGLAAGDTWRATKGIGSTIAGIATGSGRKQVSSAVGIVRISRNALKISFLFYLQVLALISLSLALLNLLPLLPLDGGHIAFSLIEGIRGRAVAREVYERVSIVGIALVLFLVFIGLSNDLGGRGGG